MKTNMTFDQIYEQNKRRIYYHIHQLRIQDPHQDYFQEGLTSLWEAYKTYQPHKGPMSTYFNYIIRNRLIDLLRKQTRYHSSLNDYLSTYPHATIHHNQANLDPTNYILSDNTLLNIKLECNLTNKQWDWLYYCGLHGMTIEELAAKKQTTTDAVKSWAREARKKLRTEKIKELILED